MMTFQSQITLHKGVHTMPKYLIERNVPGLASLSPEQLQKMAEKSNCAIEHMGPSYRWHQSYIVGDTMYCVHEAASEEAIREHSRRGGFPVTSVREIDGQIGPATVGPKSPPKRAESAAKSPVHA
jgi:hypothetical protein